MIIKSLSCKAKDPFGYLLDYFHKESTERVALTHNIIGHGIENAKQEMGENLKYLTRRRNTNQAYHEILSLKECSKIPLARQATMLEDMALFYISRRAPNCLAYGVIHHDRKHLHMHLALTPNAVKDHRRNCLSKAAFRKAQRDVEIYRLQKYPELGQETYYDTGASERKRLRDADSPTLTDREYAMKSRTQQPSRKEHDRYVIKSVFETATSEAALIEALKSIGFSVYIRGQTEGVKSIDGRKYRLKTLGLESVYQTTKQRHKFFKERLSEITPNHSNHDLKRER